MPDILVRGLNKTALQRLKARAKRHGRSLQSEAKLILENAGGYSITDALAVAESWRKKLGKRFDDSSALIRADRER
jgi:plasmid stability protein